MHRLFALLALVALTACGGSNNPAQPTPTPTPIPTPTPPVVIVQAQGVQICNKCGSWTYFTPPRPGTITITCDYSFSDSLIGLWMSPGHCTFEMSEARQCQWIVKSFVPNEKPRRVTAVVSASEYTYVIDNEGPHEETVSCQVVLSASASAPPAQAAVNAIQPGSPPPPRH
jgi:hypothetical protein